MHNNGLVYSKIVSCLRDCKQMIASAPWLVNTCRMVHEVETRMQEPMQLAIVGRLSSSKSTLVNAILGKPDVVRTGHEAETFNVSWLKYGDDAAPITVYLKNGTSQKVNRDKWAEWASHKGVESFKKDVKYIEVTSSYEMLKYINIIDTPGLDATSKVDSENTIEFLRSVRPDAVVLLFTKSLSEDSLKLIQEFQNTEKGISFSINPMNALGILSKMDMNWKVMDDNDPLQTSFAAVRRTLSGRSDVSKALFRILPVSSLMGLASSYVTEEDLSDFKSLVNIEDTKNFTKLFVSVDFFVKPYDFLSISVARRTELVEKYGLYGIFVCVKALQQNQNTSLDALSQLLNEKSGFGAFLHLLRAHFGDRASLIKAQQGVVKLLDACNKDKQYAMTPDRQELLDKVYARISNVENDLHELKEWALLLSIYEGTTIVPDDFMQEFLFMCGENGHAAVNKLNVDVNTNIEKMIAQADERCCHWRAKYNAIRRISTKRALPFETIAKSYELLGGRLQEQKQIYQRASQEVTLYNHYVYGKETKWIG